MNPFELLNLSLAVWVVAMIFGIIAMIVTIAIVVITAGRTGRSQVTWFFISFFLTPYVAGLLLILMELNERKAESQARADTKHQLDQLATQLRSLEKLVRERIPPQIDDQPT